MVRRVLFQVHLWAGVTLSLYLLVISVTGAALMFRPELQGLAHPELFPVRTLAPSADPAAVVESVQRTYPRYRVSGIDAPTTTRSSWLAYVADGDRYLTVLIDPQTAAVRGEMPDQSPIRTLQSLHFDLLAGATGRAINGAGAGSLLLLSLSGAVLWWPGTRRTALRQRLRVDFRRGWRNWIRELHALAGIVACAWLLIWSVSGLYFAYPKAFRTGVNWVTPLGKRQMVQSAGQPAEGAVRASWPQILDAARSRRPGLHVARVVLPYGPRGAVEVLFSPAVPTPSGGLNLDSVFVDAYSARALPDVRRRVAGDTFMNWLAALHVGNFGGMGVRIAWSIAGLAPTLLAMTGLLMWRTRIARTRASMVAAEMDRSP